MTGIRVLKYSFNESVKYPSAHELCYTYSELIIDTLTAKLFRSEQQFENLTLDH